MSKVVGLEIGLTNTKFVIGNKTKSKFELSDYRIIKNPEGMHDYEGHLNVSEAAPKIAQAVKELGGTRKKCYLTITSPKSIIRNRLFPFVSKKELDAMVSLEADQFLPYDANSFYIDYRILGIQETADQKSLNVMVVAVPKDIIDEQVALVEKCNMRVACVNVFVDSVHSYCGLHKDTSTGNALVVDVGYEHLRLIAFGEYEYFANITSENAIRSFEDFYFEQYNIPADALNDYLFKGIELPSDIVKKFKEDDHQRDFASLSFNSGTFDQENQNEEDGRESQFVIDYAPITNEIKKMIGFYKSRKYGNTVDQISLCGGGAYAKGLRQAISDEFGIKTMSMTYPGQENNKDSLLLTTAIGGVIRG